MLDSTLPQESGDWSRDEAEPSAGGGGAGSTRFLGHSLLDLQAEEVTDSLLPVMLLARDGRVLAASERVHSELGRHGGDLVGGHVDEALRAAEEHQRGRLRIVLNGGEVGEPRDGGKDTSPSAPNDGGSASSRDGSGCSGPTPCGAP